MYAGIYNYINTINFADSVIITEKLIFKFKIYSNVKTYFL